MTSKSTAKNLHSGTGAFFAIALREAPQDLIGGILIKTIDRPHEQGELGYWIDEAYTGRGWSPKLRAPCLTTASTWKA